MRRLRWFLCVVIAVLALLAAWPGPAGGHNTDVLNLSETPDVFELVVKYDLPPIMATVAWCESRLHPRLVSRPNWDGSQDYGLWQINDRYWGYLFKYLRWWVPGENARMAKHVYEKQGIQAWDASKQCWTEGME